MFASGRATTLLIALTSFFIHCAQVGAHTRERLRIDALELEMAKNNAYLGQRLKGIETAQERIRESLKERRAHAVKLQERLAALEASVSGELARLKTSMEKRLAAEVGTQAAALRKSDEAAAAARAVLAKDGASLAAGLTSFRKALADYGKAVDDKLHHLREELEALKAGQAADRKATSTRLAGFLKAVDEENRKLRAAIAGVNGSQPAGPSAGSKGTHVVQPGENLYGIARAYGLTFEQLQAANPQYDKPGAIIRPGDRIVIPGR